MSRTQPPDFKTDDLGERTIASPLRATRFMDTSKRLCSVPISTSCARRCEPASTRLRSSWLARARRSTLIPAPAVRDRHVWRALSGFERCHPLDRLLPAGKVRCRGHLRFPIRLRGLVERNALTPIALTTRRVGQIHEVGGTVLGSSRGPQPADEMVDTLERLGIRLLFTIGGDGTLRGAHSIVEEIRRRELEIAVVGVPKTIDNDISFIDMSFGFDTAVEAARQATRAAYVEASCHRFGIGLVKLMGRDSGFVASFATLADTQVGLCLIPEVAFTLDGVVRAARERIERDGHVVIVAAEGAG